MKAVCSNCSKDFKVYPAWVKKGAGKNCSRACAFESRRGKPSYVRTEAHKKAMSKLVASRDLSHQAERLKEINAGKKGRSIEELYGEKAVAIRARLTGQVGASNPNWKGGKQRNKYPYEFYAMRFAILERDGFTCMNCELTDKEARKLDRLGRGLTIHHIDYDKSHNEAANLITLCKWCNSKANSRRSEWQYHYQKLLAV
jgi:hypothetical protein